jgi:integrase
MLALFLDLGLRVGELASLRVEDIDLDAGTLTFYREKVDKVQVHALVNGSLSAARAYLIEGWDGPQEGALIVGSTRAGGLTDQPMTTRAISKRVRVLGQRIGVKGISAHDLRHFWATRAARMGTPLDRLMQAGGWSSPAMPMRYVAATRVANQGVSL